MNRAGVFNVVYFFLYVIAQVLLFKRLVLFNTSFCFLYVAFILLLPVETNNLLLMVLAFVLGFTIDIFYDSLGIHALALVTVAYLRNYWLSSITPQGGYDAGSSPALTNGVQWFLVYTVPLVFVHLALLFFIEAGGFGMFWFTMLKVMASLLFTVSVMLMLQFFSGTRS
ncbi:MAG TPA: Rod shape-determining protein MreD [Cyclobacteriaceae bacterium]|nr:Rod shape-determining protein MreD [Cyclobacteriaceae bacterium]